MYYRISLLVVVSLVYANLNAQKLHHSYHFSPIDVAACITISPNGNYLIGGSTGQFQGWPSFRPYLMAIDPQGNVLWEHIFSDIDHTELGIIEDIAFDEEQGIAYVVSFTSGCDYGLPNALYQVTSEGEVTLLTTLENDVKNISFIPNLGPVIQYNYYDILHYYDVETATLLEIDALEGSSFFAQSIVTDNSTRLAIVAISRAALLTFSDSIPILVAEENVAMGRDISYLPSDDAFIVMGLKKLYKLDGNNMEKENTINIENWGFPHRIQCTNDKVYVLFYKDEAFSIIVFDHLLNFVEEFDLSPAYNNPTDFIIQDDRLVITGYANASLSGHSYFLLYENLGSDFFVRSYELGQGSLSDIDISLDAITCSDTTVSINEDFSCSNTSGIMSLYFSGIQVEVTNHSDSVLNSIVLNTGNNNCSFICPSASTLSKSFNNLSLQPGQSTVLTFGDYNTSLVPYQENYEFCIWASSPNGMLDDDFTDNVTCMPVDVTTIVSTHTPQQAYEHIEVYPNPATDVLHIKTSRSIPGNTTISVTNLMGEKLISVETQHNQQVFELDIEHLPSGVYVIYLEQPDVTFTQKWVKQ